MRKVVCIFLLCRQRKSPLDKNLRKSMFHRTWKISALLGSPLHNDGSLDLRKCLGRSLRCIEQFSFGQNILQDMFKHKVE